MKLIINLIKTIILIPLAIVGGLGLGIMYLLFLPFDFAFSMLCEIWEKRL